VQAQNIACVTPRIDPEFKSLIPPLTPEEYTGLERSILEEGVREPLVTWQGVIVDGHNRFEIATRHGLPYKCLEHEFDSREDAMLWMIHNQLSRRNLKPIDAGLLAQTMLSIEKNKASGRKAAGVSLPDSSQGGESYDLAGKAFGISGQTVRRVERIANQPDSKDIIARIRSGESSIYDEDKKIREAKKKAEKVEQVRRAQSYIESQNDSSGSATLVIGDSIGMTVECDLLLTDPPYSTDVDNIDTFADSWLYAALEGVRPTGFAYVFIGAYPNELRAYLNADIPDHIKLEQVLVWTYKNTLGNNPKARYKQNYQACLFFRGIDAPDLDCPLTSEQWAVQEINAPDGRLGDRYHAWQKPLEIAERFIRHSTKKGMTVYDPFACTGTFLVAAAKLGRIGVGYELNHDNAEIAFERGVSRG